MAQQDKELPEGTDTVITGAMETDTSDQTRRGRGSRSPATRSGSSAIMDKVRSSSDKLSGQAAGKARRRKLDRLACLEGGEISRSIAGLDA